MPWPRWQPTFPGPVIGSRSWGVEVLETLPVPPIALQLRTGIAMVSYADSFVFGITGDHDTAPDMEPLAAGIEHAGCAVGGDQPSAATQASTGPIRGRWGVTAAPQSSERRTR